MAVTNPYNPSIERLFTPLRIGKTVLKHRIVHSPLTRLRSPSGVPTDAVVDYYAARATEGGLLIGEGVHISVQSGNYFNCPGVYTPEQLRAWRKVTSAVHAKGGVIYAQLWHVGRLTSQSYLGGELSAIKPLSSTSQQLEGGTNPFNPKFEPIALENPKQMDDEDMGNTREDFVHAAKLCIEAGFDGIEVHAAGGYLIDQFWNDNINTRTDEYGGSIENRTRFPLQIIDDCIAAIGPDRVAIRISPFGTYSGAQDSDPVSHWCYILRQLVPRKLAFIEVVEPRNDIYNGTDDKTRRLVEAAKRRGVVEEQALEDELSLKPFRRALLGSGIPLFSTGGWNHKSDYSHIGEESDRGVEAVSIGRWFISNPDLVERFKTGKPLSLYDRATFYTPGPEGYVDYESWQEAVQNGRDLQGYEGEVEEILAA
ncbi:MAG: hypothetical protein M1818_007358 [Claussenomyces sp. TS43310]|nr:MAG: hypothetical protein M1818_007358 [Claussenomyces sp. TS43310]